MSRERPGTTAYWIKLLYYIFIKWFSTFGCSKWPYGCILMAIKLMEVGWAGSIRLRSGYKSYHTMSRERQGTPSDLITHLSYIYKNYLSTFRCSGWPFGCILMAIKLMEVDWAGWIRVRSGYKSYHYIKGKTRNSFRLNYNYILYI